MFSNTAAAVDTQAVASRNRRLLSTAEADSLERACLGGGLPHEAERHLCLAGLNYHEDSVAEAHLQQAQALAPDHIGVYIGLYRFYFYKGRLSRALQIAEVCLEKSARNNGLAADWRQVHPSDAPFGSYEAVLPRFYLFALKAYGYLQMRLGNFDEGHAALAKMLELDPSDKLGGSTLLRVLERMGLDDDD